MRTTSPLLPQTLTLSHLRLRYLNASLVTDLFFLHAGSLWDPPADVRANISAYLDCVARVLKPGGLFVYITWRQPHFIRPLLQREGVWTAEVETLADEPGGGGMLEYFGWVVRKL